MELSKIKNDPIDEASRHPIVDRIEQMLVERGIQKNQVRNTIIEITGLSKQALVKWFNGDTASPRAEHIAQIAEMYNADLAWLITGKKLDPNNHITAIKESNDIDSVDGHGTLIADRLATAMTGVGVEPRKIRSTMATICGITAQGVHSWFNGQTKAPQAQHIAAVAKYTDADLHYLITGEKNPKTKSVSTHLVSVGHCENLYAG